MSELYKLANVYELDSSFDNTDTHIRIEVFEAIEDQNYRRIKVWAKRNYDMYPTFMNIGKTESDKTYSSDSIALDITNLITDDLLLVTGKKIEETQILQEAIDGIKKALK